MSHVCNATFFKPGEVSFDNVFHLASYTPSKAGVPKTVAKLSSMKLVPGAKWLEDLCPKGTGPCNNQPDFSFGITFLFPRPSACKSFSF